MVEHAEIKFLVGPNSDLANTTGYNLRKRTDLCIHMRLFSDIFNVLLDNKHNKGKARTKKLNYTIGRLYIDKLF